MRGTGGSTTAGGTPRRTGGSPGSGAGSGTRDGGERGQRSQALSARAIRVVAGLALAAFFWVVIFGWRIVNFWAGMVAAAVVLTAYAVLAGGVPWKRDEWTYENAVVGAAGALGLFAIFALGNWVARVIFPFASGQIGDVYSIREQADRLLIGAILLLVTSPAEEIFWRGFLQRQLSAWVGPGLAWVLGALVYALVHVASGNLMLVLAAFVAGLGWGLLLLWRRSVVPGIISHSLWTVMIFLLFPLNDG